MLYPLSWRQVVVTYLSVIVIFPCGKQKRDERYMETSDEFIGEKGGFSTPG